MHPAGSLSASDRRLSWAIGIAVAALLLLTFHGFLNITDGRSMYEVTRSIVEERDLTIAEAPLVSVEGRRGEPYSKYGIGLPVLAIPLYAAGWVVAAVAGEKGLITELFVTAAMPITYGLLAAVSFVLARRLGGSRRSSVAVAVGGPAGTFALTYSQEFFSEPVAALLMVVALERLLADKVHHAGVALALAVVVRPQTAVVVPVYLIVAVVRRRVPGLIGMGVPLAAGAGVIALYNLARFGDVVSTGYEGEGFTTPFTEGVAGLLFEGTKSIWVFAPAILLVAPALVELRRNLADAAVAIGGTFVAVFISSAVWHSWPGGFSWGPRLLLPAVPLAVCAIAPWLDRGAWRLRAAGVLFVLGFLASAATILVPSTAQLVLPAEMGRGPSIVSQYALVDDVVSNTIDGECENARNLEFLPDRRHCTVALWQVEVVRRFGTAGWAASIVSSGVLGAVAVTGARRTAAELRTSERATDPIAA